MSIELSKKDCETRLQQDRGDLGKEVSGADSGRMKRFGASPGDNGIQADEKKRAKDALLVALLDELASQADVDALMASVANLQDRLDQAFADLEADTDTLDARTAHLRCGTTIYLMEDGRYRTVGGDVVDPSDLPDNLPDAPATWDEYQALLARRAQLSGIQTDVIDVITERAAEGDMTAREVSEFERIVRDADSSLDGHSPSIESVEQEATNPSPPPVSSLGQSPIF